MYEYHKIHEDKTDYIKIIINVVINVGLIGTFIGVFYFLYVITIEEEFVKKQLDILSINLINSIKPFLSDDMKKFIIKNIKKPNLQKQDLEIEEHNNKLRKNAIVNISIIFIVTMIIGYVLCRYYKHDYKLTMRDNLILLCMIGLTEFSFLHMIPANYITTDPNFIKYKLASNIKQKITITM
jgi:hypothetical protein